METDKLVAISGIAKVFESELKDLYLCGLWRTNLEMQLLWGITRKTKIPVKLPGETAYVAPSWSWASCTAAVDYFEERRRQYIYPGTQIVEFDIQYETSDVFGQVKSASLYISCFGFARVKIDYFRLPYFWFWEGLRIKAYTNFDWLPAINEDNQMDGQQIYLLPLVIDGQQKSHIGLMLVPTERKTVNTKDWGRLGWEKMIGVGSRPACHQIPYRIKWRNVLRRYSNSRKDSTREEGCGTGILSNLYEEPSSVEQWILLYAHFRQ